MKRVFAVILLMLVPAAIAGCRIPRSVDDGSAVASSSTALALLAADKLPVADELPVEDELQVEDEPLAVTVASLPPTQDLPPAEPAYAEVRSIEEYVQLGLSLNPRIDEALNRVEAARFRIPQALAQPDPMLMTRTRVAPHPADMEVFELNLSQPWTIADRRETRAAVADREVAMAQAELEMVRQEIAADIRVACHQLQFIRQTIVITREDRQSLERIVDVIDRKYEVDRDMTQQDVLNARIELSQIENDLTELLQRERSAEARLARLLHRQPGQALGIGDDAGGMDASALDAEALIDRALIARPDLQAQLATIDRQQRRVALAQLEYRPDWNFGLNWMAMSEGAGGQASGEGYALRLTAGLNLPIYRQRIRAGVCEALAESRASESRFESLRDMAAEEVVDLVARLESTREVLQLVRADIIPKAEQTLDASIDQYTTGSIDYVQLIENWRALLRHRITEARLESEIGQLTAELARAVGQIEPLGR